MTVAGISMVLKPVETNAPCPISVSEAGKVNSVIDSHSKNAASPIRVIVSGSVIFFSDLQPEKVYCSRVVTPSGITTLSSDSHSAKQNDPIYSRLSGRLIVLSSLQTANALD